MILSVSASFLKGSSAKRLGQKNHFEKDVYASSAIADGKSHYGCVLYVREEDADCAVRVLKH